MQLHSDVAVIVIEQENQTTLTQAFMHAAASLQIQNLVLLSPDYLSDMPAELKFEALRDDASLEERLLIIRKAADLLQGGIKPSKKALDFKLRRMTVLVHNFGLAKALKREHEQEKQRRIEEFNVRMKQWEQAAGEIMKTYWEDQSVIDAVPRFPAYDPPESIEIMFYKAQLKAYCCFSGYLQCFDDAAVGEYVKDANFNELMQKIGAQVYQLPRPIEFLEDQLFYYVYNPYELRQEIPWSQFIRIPDKPDDEAAKKKKKTEKKHKDDGFFGADGSLILMKVMKFITDNLLQKSKEDDLLIQTVPMFYIRNCGKFIPYYKAAGELPNVASVMPKDEKQFMAYCKAKFDDYQLGQPIMTEIVAVLDKMVGSDEFYGTFLQKNKVVSWGAAPTSLKLLSYFDADKTCCNDRIVEIGKVAQKPVKGAENIVRMCRLKGFVEDRSYYLRRLRDDPVFAEDIARQISLSGKPADLQKYNEVLDRLPNEYQNQVSSVIEAMIMQLEAREAEEAPQPASKQAKRAPSAKRLDYTLKAAKVDKNAPPPPAIPFREDSVFGITQKDLNIYNLTLDYADEPKQISDKIVRAIQGYLYSGDIFYEISTKVTENGVEIAELCDPKQEEDDKFITGFMERAYKHDYRLIDHYTGKIVDFKAKLTKALQDKNRAEWEARKQEYQRYRQEEREQQSANVDPSDSIIEGTDSNVRQSEYEGEYYPIEVNVDNYFDFYRTQYQNSANSYASIQHRSCLFALLGDFLQIDEQCDEKNSLFKVKTSNWQDIQRNAQNQSHLLQVFNDSMPRLFYAAPQFNVFINNEVVQDALLSGQQPPLIRRLTQRFVLPRLQQAYAYRAEFAYPLFPCYQDAVDVYSFAGNICLFNYYKSNVQEVVDSLFGSVAFVRDYSQAEQDEDAHIAEMSARSTKSKQSLKPQQKTQSAQYGQTQKPVSGQQTERKIMSATRHSAEQDLAMHFFTKYTQTQQQGFNDISLETKLQSKLSLPFYNLPDIETEISSFAPNFDIKAADIAELLLTDSDSLGLHFIVNSPALGRVEHTVLNESCEIIKFVLQTESFEERKIGKFEEPMFSTPGYNVGIIQEWLQQHMPQALQYPENPNLDTLTVKQIKQLKDLEVQQLAELKRRKKRAYELATLCKSVSEQRSRVVEQEIGKDIVGRRPTKARASCFIANLGARLFCEDDLLVYDTEDFKIYLDADLVQLTIRKDFSDINFGYLGVYDNSGRGDFLNVLLKLREKVYQSFFKHIRLLYVISLSGIVIRAEMLDRNKVASEIVLLEQRFENFQTISDELKSDCLVYPKTGSKYRESIEETSVVSAIYRLIDGDVTHRELFYLGWSVLLPQLEEDSRTVNYFTAVKGLASIASCSRELPKQRYTELLELDVQPYTEQQHYLNVLEGLNSKKDQILKQNQRRLAAKVFEIAQTQSYEAFFIYLPFGATIMVNEQQQIKVILCWNDCCDHFFVEKEHAAYFYSDAFEVGVCKHDFYFSDAKSTLQKSPEQLSQQLKSGNTQNCYCYDVEQFVLRSSDVTVKLGEPNYKCIMQPRDPHFFTPNRDILLKPDEIPAKGLLMFRPGLYNQRVHDYLQGMESSVRFSPRFFTRNMNVFFYVYECDEICVSNVVMCDEIKSTIVALQNHCPELLRKVFESDFEMMQKALGRMIPKYQRPTFIKSGLRQPSYERSFQMDTGRAQQADTSRTDESRCSDAMEAAPRIPKASEVLKTVRKDVHGQIKLNIENKFETKQSYWQTPEGRLFSKDSASNEEYVRCIQHYDDLSAGVLDPASKTHQKYVQPSNFSGNLFQKSLQHHRRNTLPAALKYIEQPKPPEKQLPTLQEPKRQLNVQTIIDYALGENQALAGVNMSYLDKERGTLRRTKNASAAASPPESRQLLLEPNLVNILITPDDMAQFRSKWPQQSYFPLYYRLKATNIGRESLHLRWNRKAVENSNVHDVEIITQRGGICPGLSIYITVEFRIDFSLQYGETLDAIVLRSEEEIIAIPVSIFYGLPEEEVKITQAPPRAYSQQSDLLREKIAVDAQDLTKTSVEVVECIEQSAGENIDEDYEPVDLGEMQQMQGYGGDELVNSAANDVEGAEKAGEQSSGDYDFEEITE